MNIRWLVNFFNLYILLCLRYDLFIHIGDVVWELKYTKLFGIKKENRYQSTTYLYKLKHPHFFSRDSTTASKKVYTTCATLPCQHE